MKQPRGDHTIPRGLFFFAEGFMRVYGQGNGWGGGSGHGCFDGIGNGELCLEALNGAMTSH